MTRSPDMPPIRSRRDRSPNWPVKHHGPADAVRMAIHYWGAAWRGDASDRERRGRSRRRSVSPALVAALRFRGSWSAANYLRYLEVSRTGLRSAGLTAVGSPCFARFAPPDKPWFMRRNEIVLSLEDPT